MTELNLKKLESSGDLKVLNRGGIYKYSYGKEKLIADVEGLSGVADGKWFIGNLSLQKGGDSPFSKTHETGVDVDVAIPLKGGESSANAANWDNFPENSKKAFSNVTASSESKKWKKWGTVKERKESPPIPGMPDFAKKELEKYTSFTSSGQIDSYKSAQLMKYFVDKGFIRVLLDRSLFNNIAYDFEENLKKGTIKEDDELLQFVKNYIPNNKRTKRPLFHFKGHKDHFHFRMEGSGILGDPEDRKAGEGSDSKEREKKRRKSKLQLKRRLLVVPAKFTNDFKSVGDEGFEEVSKEIYENGDFREWFVDWMLGTVGNEFVNSRNKKQSISPADKTKVYKSIKKYAESGYREDKIDDLTYEFISFFVAFYNGRGKSQFKQWTKENLFTMTSPMQENKNMKITKERLAQIIKEEVEAYKASQISELDVDELEEAEAYIKEVADLLKSTYETIFKGAAPAIGVPQTKAYTNEPVTDQTAHEDAKALLLDLLGDAIDEFQQKEPELNEDGHDDVPSAVRAMKTMAEDALEMLDALEQMDGTLPTWWTNKMAVSASMLNKMRDYLHVPSEDEVLDEQ